MTSGELLAVGTLGGIALLGLGVVAYLYRSEKAAKNSQYKEMDRGVYDHAEYASEGGKYGGEVTVIHFEDGRTSVLRGFHSVPYKRGDIVKVMENEWDSKLEKA